MANVFIKDTNLTNIANTIRGKNGSSDMYKPSEMAVAIEALSVGGEVSGGYWELIAAVTTEEPVPNIKLDINYNGMVDKDLFMVICDLKMHSEKGRDWFYFAVNSMTSNRYSGEVPSISPWTEWGHTTIVFNAADKSMYFKGIKQKANNNLNYINIYPYIKTNSISGSVRVFKLQGVKVS